MIQKIMLTLILVVVLVVVIVSVVFAQGENQGAIFYDLNIYGIMIEPPGGVCNVIFNEPMDGFFRLNPDGTRFLHIVDKDAKMEVDVFDESTGEWFVGIGTGKVNANIVNIRNVEFQANGLITNQEGVSRRAICKVDSYTGEYFIKLVGNP